MRARVCVRVKDVRMCVCVCVRACARITQTCSTLVQPDLVLGLCRRADDDELMLNVLRCHETY